MRKRSWLRWAAVVLLVLLAASAGFSRLLRTTRVHRYLVARLEAAFGRRVEVKYFEFSLRDGPRLQAESVTVAEDPRFGREYFLRAERLAASPRWRSLAGGRFEFGTLSFTRPSLNLVREADGHWNIESWLPPPEPAPGAAPARASAPTRLYRIEVDGGRINFKRGVDKLPFAFDDVSGHLEQQSAGRWQLDLEARPMLATVVLQQAGTLRLRGGIAGTSARLQPAELALTWWDASLADALRLVRGRDYGVRGRLAVELTAHIERPSTDFPPPAGPRAALKESSGEEGASKAGGARWSFTITTRLQDVHRWDLVSRPGDPSLNLQVEAQWRPGEARVEFSKGLLEAPRSSVGITGKVQWATALDPQFRMASSWISFTDLLAWYRAFRPDAADDLAFDGGARVDLALSRWPLRLEQGEVMSNGARFKTAALSEPIRLGRLGARVVHGLLKFEPATITLPAGPPGGTGEATRESNSLRVEAVVGPGGRFSRVSPSDWGFDLDLKGQTARLQDLLVAARALGHTVNRDWSAEGPASLRLRWQGSVYPFAAKAVGEINLRGLRVGAKYLNRRLSLVDARIELRPDERRVTLAGVQGFGARWTGWLRSRAAEPWEFDLTADRLDAAELDRWLGPRARPRLFQRIVPFGGASRDSSESDAAVGLLRCHGRLSVGEVVLSRLSLHRVRAETEIAGRNIALRQAQAEFYGGTVKGSLRAELSAQPVYRFEGSFERVNLGSLADATAALKDRFAGLASGGLEFVASGVGRENLLGALKGRGQLQVRGAEVHGLDLKATYSDETFRPGTSRFAAAAARFSLAAGKVRLEQLRLSDRGDDFDGEGTVDLSHSLDIQIRMRKRTEENGSGSLASRTLHIRGPLGALQVTRLESQAPKK